MAFESHYEHWEQLCAIHALLSGLQLRSPKVYLEPLVTYLALWESPIPSLATLTLFLGHVAM